MTGGSGNPVRGEVLQATEGGTNTVSLPPAYGNAATNGSNLWLTAAQAAPERCVDDGT